MRRYLLLLLLIVGCSVKADVKTYNLSWDANTEPDLAGYKIYQWIGADTTLSPLDTLISGANYTQYYIKTITETTTTIQAESDGINYIQVGMSAIDVSGNESNLGLSKFYLTLDSDAPSAPKNVVIE